jgi:hypothetical protein
VFRLSVGYGLWSGPTDRRLRQVTINYQRHLWIRDMMVKNGDAHKAIWISEAGWNPVPNDPAIVEVERYGRVTMEQAAAWAPLAYERAIKEWPWIGVISWWYFKPADDHNMGDSSYYFRLVEPDHADAGGRALKRISRASAEGDRRGTAWSPESRTGQP